MVQIDSKDIDILDGIGCDEPWHIIAAIFHYHFSNQRELPERIVHLRDLGLLTIDPDTTSDILLADAEKNQWHEETDWPDGPVWSLKVTELGFDALKAHGKEWTKSANHNAPTNG